MEQFPLFWDVGCFGVGKYGQSLALYWFIVSCLLIIGSVKFLAEIDFFKIRLFTSLFWNMVSPCLVSM